MQYPTYKLLGSKNAFPNQLFGSLKYIFPKPECHKWWLNVLQGLKAHLNHHVAEQQQYKYCSFPLLLYEQTSAKFQLGTEDAKNRLHSASREHVPSRSKRSSDQSKHGHHGSCAHIRDDCNSEVLISGIVCNQYHINPSSNDRSPLVRDSGVCQPGDRVPSVCQALI